MFVEWLMYRALAKLLCPQCVPYILVNPYELFDTMMSDGKGNWGRRVLFVDWLAGTFGNGLVSLYGSI